MGVSNKPVCNQIDEYSNQPNNLCKIMDIRFVTKNYYLVLGCEPNYLANRIKISVKINAMDFRHSDLF